MADYTNHEKYSCPSRDSDYDITLIELAKEVDLKKYTPACLPHPRDPNYPDPFAGKTAYVYGDRYIYLHTLWL